MAYSHRKLCLCRFFSAISWFSPVKYYTRYFYWLNKLFHFTYCFIELENAWKAITVSELHSIAMKYDLNMPCERCLRAKSYIFIVGCKRLTSRRLGWLYGVSENLKSLKYFTLQDIFFYLCHKRIPCSRWSRFVLQHTIKWNCSKFINE